MASRSLIWLAGLAGALGFALAQPVPARAGGVEPAKTAAGDDIPAVDPTYKGNDVKVDEHLGAQLPLDAAFRDQDGKRVTLSEVMRGGLPAILTFNYSDCPMLCSVQLNGLTTALPKVGAVAPSPDPSIKRDIALRPGAQYRIITIDLEPNETLEKAHAMRQRYLDRFPEDQRKAAEAGWTFLIAATPGDASAIHRVADAVGFRYTFIKERAEWAHPAALIFLSAAGAVTRYLYGVEFEPKVMRESIYKAGLAEPSAAVGFMIRCYHYDPGANSHARAGVMTLRIGAALFAIVLFTALGVLHFMRRRRSVSAASNGVP
ncbi:MAG TPA: SCO family protein [Kofleriaceae bacterium]|nr:SCO family protein [Kofleriaceae bacterium]